MASTPEASPFRGHSDGPVIAVVGALARIGRDVGLPVVLVGKHEEALAG